MLSLAIFSYTTVYIALFVYSYALYFSLGNKDDEVKTSLFKRCFTSLMTRDTNIVKESLSALVNRLTENKPSSAELRDLLLRLNSQFPGDVGCFCIYFLNHIILKPGQAMFLAPNLPHAYLDGGTKIMQVLLGTQGGVQLFLQVNFQAFP